MDINKNKLIFNPKTGELEIDTTNSNEVRFNPTTGELEIVSSKNNELVFDPTTGELVIAVDNYDAQTITSIAEDGFAGFEITSYDIVMFLDWLNITKPEIEKSQLNAQILQELALDYCISKPTYYYREFRNELFNYFFKSKLKDKTLSQFFGFLKKNKTKKVNIDLFSRYKNIKFHGVFIFSDIHKHIHNFIINNWLELNNLTVDLIDVYFSKKDVKNKTGIDILKSFGFSDNLEVILPSLIIWHNNMKNAITFDLTKFDDIEIFNLFQHLVIEIRKEKNLSDIFESVKNKIFKNHNYKTNIININGNENIVIQDIDKSTIELDFK